MRGAGVVTQCKLVMTDAAAAAAIRTSDRHQRLSEGEGSTDDWPKTE